MSVWGAFAGGVKAVAGVEEDFHGVEATARDSGVKVGKIYYI